jgi:hypothetical protein
VMQQKTFCERIAAEYEQRAEETTDEEVREFFRRMRENWLKVASGLDASIQKKVTSPHLTTGRRGTLH